MNMVLYYVMRALELTAHVETLLCHEVIKCHYIRFVSIGSYSNQLLAW